MWLFLTRRLRVWLLASLVLPLVSALLRRLGEGLQRRRGRSALSDGLLRAGRLGEQARERLRGGRGQRGRRGRRGR